MQRRTQKPLRAQVLAQPFDLGNQNPHWFGEGSLPQSEETILDNNEGRAISSQPITAEVEQIVAKAIARSDELIGRVAMSIRKHGGEAEVKTNLIIEL